MFLDPQKDIKKHRINLPHWHQDSTWQFVTWRLADSLPQTVIERIQSDREHWLARHPKPWDETVQKEHNRLFTQRYEELLDQSHGSCVLRDPANARIVADALLHFHDDRYRLDSFVVMPNHVHVLFEPLGDHHLEEILHSWKRFTSRQINQGLGQTGQLWQREYWDRLIRSEEHFAWTRNYILQNPAKLPPNTFLLYGEGV